MCGRVHLSTDVNEIERVLSIPPHRPSPNYAPSWNADLSSADRMRCLAAAQAAAPFVHPKLQAIECDRYVGSDIAVDARASSGTKCFDEPRFNHIGSRDRRRSIIRQVADREIRALPPQQAMRETGMGARTAFCARVESRPNEALGDFMSSIRVWLDRRRIDLVGFKSAPGTSGIAAFDLYFQSDEAAVLFRREFARNYL
jgi:hypothetical protein